MKKLAWILGSIVLLAVLVDGALIAFGTALAPSTSAMVRAFKGVDFSTLPAVEAYAARDGALLGYRHYSAASPAAAAVVLIHGAADSGVAFHSLALSLQKANVDVYVPQGRGHGISVPRGNIDYVGQLDDDLVDFVAALRAKGQAAPLRIVAFSSGGGFALRFAVGPFASLFERYLLLAPGLTITGPIVRPKSLQGSAAASFSAPYIPRLIGLGFANSVGIHAFDALPVIDFAVPADSPVLTRNYSLRMLNNLMPIDYARSIQALRVPTTVMIGDKDDFSVPAEVERAFAAAHPPIPTRILPDTNHTGLVSQPTGIRSIQEWALSP